jgi:hypothetical protein
MTIYVSLVLVTHEDEWNKNKLLLLYCTFLTCSISSGFVTLWICRMKIQYNTMKYKLTVTCRFLIVKSCHIVMKFSKGHPKSYL